MHPAVVQDLVSKSKSLKNRSPPQSMKASYPMQRVAVDIVGPSPQTAKGNLYVLVAAERLFHMVSGSLCNSQSSACPGPPPLPTNLCEEGEGEENSNSLDETEVPATEEPAE